MAYSEWELRKSLKAKGLWVMTQQQPNLQPIIEKMLAMYNAGASMSIAQATLYVEILNKLKNLRDSLWSDHVG